MQSDKKKEFQHQPKKNFVNFVKVMRIKYNKNSSLKSELLLTDEHFNTRFPWLEFKMWTGNTELTNPVAQCNSFVIDVRVGAIVI